MKSKIFTLILGIFLLSFISAIGICVDHDPPTWPEDTSFELEIVNENNIKLNWSNATDIPECSGIDYYEIYRGKNKSDLTLINYSINSEYLDENLDYGEYTYMIHAYDKVGQNEGETGILAEITLKSSDGNGGGSGGGSGGSGTYINYYECGNWSECINGTQTRICNDTRNPTANLTETRECDLNEDFTPLNDSDNDNATETPENDSELTFDDEEQERFSALTGAVIGTLGSGKGLIAIALLIILGLAVIFIVVKNKKK